MSLDHAGGGAEGGNGTAEAEATPSADAPSGRSGSLWFLVVPIALALAAAAIAFFLLSPRDEELMTTADPEAVAVAVASVEPAQPAFTNTAP